MENTKGSLLPNERALLYLRKQFVQSAKLQGRIGKFSQVHEVKYIGTDQHYEWDDPVDVAYHIDTNPSRKILLRYGWFTEDQQGLPIILYLTYHDMDDKPIIVQEGALITLSGKRTIGENDIETETFQITEVKSDLELNQAVCKISPFRLKQTENVKVLADKKDPNLENVYLNRHIYYDELHENEDTFIKRGGA